MFCSSQSYAKDWKRVQSFFKKLFIQQDTSPFIRNNGTIRYDQTAAPHILNGRLLFSPDDQIQIEVTADEPTSEPISFFMSQDSHQDVGNFLWESAYYHYRHRSRGTSDSAQARDFNRELMDLGISDPLVYPPRSGANLIATSSVGGEAQPFMHFSLMAGVESYDDIVAGGLGPEGRQFASRPFLHSSAIRAATIDGNNPDAIYNYGWNWWIEPINTILEAPVQVAPGGKGYYGGGYGFGSGSTNVVQQEIPVVPPMSLASLSHAQLGGISLADGVPNLAWQNELEPVPLATGKGGMFPYTLQAIGNSYAHPYIRAQDAYNENFPRTFNDTDGPTSVVFADHSYLANKALWDEFFFSSITPQPTSVQAFGGSERSAKEVATDFFLNDDSLPNRRMTPSRTGLDTTKLDQLFNEADVFGNGYEGNFGLADKIAAYLMVKGPFNVNSTSVEAWRALLSSLKGKPVAYLDKDKALAGVTVPDEANTTGAPVSAFNLPNAQPSGASSLPSDPEQWLGWRELNDTEIQELAEAIVRQVKLRGPFLSLSEFVNRRLDSDNLDLSVKGALQAALDDAGVSINANFRDNIAREFSPTEISGMNPEFPAALEGPVAYGSAAYVDQADLLRNFASQLTPRGDTFVIRSYGDAIEVTGEVSARAWCEAVVQRMPEYVNPAADEAYVKARNLQPSNKTFGRKFEIVSFRWLSKDEI